ncbi:hypothetical protein HD806DRAFT_519085 [Xylariaceae sp. AK1471]|nr:hypothetical protein HD806DRAFT_519085 [Xylariaceae sp. AK1471]
MQLSSGQSPSGPGRQLGNLEIFFKTLADKGKPLKREHWTIHLAVALEFPASLLDPVPHVKCAWQALRLQHSVLGAAVFSSGEDAGNPLAQSRLVTDDLNLDAWAEDTFAVCHQYSSADELFSDVHATETPTCYWLPKSSQLVIRSSHWRTDGVGMAILGHDLLMALATTLHKGFDPLDVAQTLVTGIQINQPSLPISLEELARNQSQYSTILHYGKENPILAAGADALVAEFLQGVPSIGLPTFASSEDAVPSRSGRTTKSIDAGMTSQISSACRKSGFTVTSAVHAAIIRVTASFPQHSLAKSYAAFVPVDLRQTLPASAGRAVGLYFSGLPVCIGSIVSQDGATRKPFELIARELGSVYSRDHIRFWKPSEDNNKDEFVGLLDLVEPYVRRTTMLFNAPIPESLPPVQTPDLSSLGKMEKYIQPEYRVEESVETVKVVDLWMGTEMLNRSIQFHVWSWKGALHLGACFNTSFYEQNFVVGVVDMIVEELLVGCKVSE